MINEPQPLQRVPYSQRPITPAKLPGVSQENLADLHETLTHNQGSTWFDTAGNELYTSHENHHLIIQHLTSGNIVSKQNADQLLTYAKNNGMTHVVGSVPKILFHLVNQYMTIGAGVMGETPEGHYLMSYPSKSLPVGGR